MSDYIYARLTLTGKEDDKVLYQARLATDEVRRICDLVGVFEPEVQWWRDTRNAWTPDANTQTFAFPCEGWVRGVNTDVINLRMPVHEDETRDTFAMLRFARHELAHWMQSHDPGRWRDDMTVSARGSHCSRTAVRAESSLMFKDSDWRNLCPSHLRNSWRRHQLTCQALVRQMINGEPLSYAMALAPAVEDLQREADEQQRLQQQRQQQRQATPAAPKQPPAAHTKRREPEQLVEPDLPSIGWVTDLATNRPVRPGLLAVPERPRSRRGLEIAAAVSGGILEIR